MSDNANYRTEIVDLPSHGLPYPEGHPLRESGGKIEIKYMTTKEEDMLMSENLIKQGVVLDKVLDSIIVTEGVKNGDLLIGDRNALLVATRILAYGRTYRAKIMHNGNEIDYNFDLTECRFKPLPTDIDYTGNRFSFKLPITEQTVEFKLLTVNENKVIDQELENVRKYQGQSTEITTRLRHSIVSVGGNEDNSVINKFVSEMLSMDSVTLRNEIKRIMPDIIMEQTIEVGGQQVKAAIPLTPEFFWPESV